MLLSLPFLLIYFALSALLVRTDIRTGLLPDKFLCPLLWTGLLYQLCLHPDFFAERGSGCDGRIRRIRHYLLGIPAHLPT